MAAIPELIYCSDGNRRFAEIAIDAGFTYGAQMPNTIYFQPEFVDQNWKSPDLNKYAAVVVEHNPRLATVLDWEQTEQLPEVLSWAETIAPYVEMVIIIPKVIGEVGRLPRIIGGRPVRLGYSVPTRFGGTCVPAWEFGGWPVHLLGGSPQVQYQLSYYMDVRSVDGNMHLKMATQYNTFFDLQKRTRRGYWPSLKDFDGKKWGDGSASADAPYEAFRRSCLAIHKMWRRR